MEKEKQIKEIEALKAALEEASGFKIETPKNFEQLRGVIFRRTGEYISTTTLKRIWGYLNEPLQTRPTTLSLLARTVGYKDWEDFVMRSGKASTEKKIPSSPKFGKAINVNSDMKEGDRVMLYWHPGRECLVRYEGKMQFVVEESKKTRLKPGDTFYCHLIIAGHPLYLSNLKHGNAEPVAYICGRIHGGIQFERISASDQTD